MLDEQSGSHPACWECWVTVPVLCWHPSPLLSGSDWSLQAGRHMASQMSPLLWCSNHPLSYQNIHIILTDSPDPTQLLQILDQTNWLLLLPFALGQWRICFLVLGFQSVWISPSFRLIFLYVVMWSGALGKDREEQQQQLGSEQSLWLPLWERTQAGDCSDINIQGWIDSVQDMSLLGAVKLRHDCFPSFVLLCEGMKGVQQQVSFLPQNELLEDKWSSAARSCWCCFPLGFKFCTQSQSW